MLELPELTPEHFEILVMRELRKIGLDVSELRTHRRSMLPEPERGYLLELKGVVRGTGWQRRTLIACRRQQRPIVAAEVELLKEDRKSTRLNSSHTVISYAVFCSKKKKVDDDQHQVADPHTGDHAPEHAGAFAHDLRARLDAVDGERADHHRHDRIPRAAQRQHRD